MNRKSSFVAACAMVSVLGLMGCSSTPDVGSGVLREAGTAVRATLTSRGTQSQSLRPTAGFPGLDPSALGAHSTAAIGAYLEDRQALAALVPSGSNGAVVTWVTADQISLSLTGGGILTSTRGLGGDLHGAEAGQTAALVAAGRAGTAARRHVYLDGSYRPQSMTLTCTVQPAGTERLVLNGRAHATQVFDERCTREDGPAIANRYWRDAAGPTIRQSSQWVGPGVGMIHLQRLID